MLSLCVNVIIYFNIQKYKINLNIENRLFSYLVKGTLSVLIVDVVRLYVNARTGFLMYELNLISSTIMILMTPVVPMFWSFYIEYKIFSDKDRIKRHFPFLIMPAVINTFFVLISFLSGTNERFIFFIDSKNQYMRGDLFSIMVIMSYTYFVYSFFFLKYHQKHIDQKDYDTLLLFALPPFIGGILQTAFPSLNITWIAMTISLFIIYINIQNKLLYIDVLTGLYNRRSLNKHFKNLFMRKSKDYFVGGILLDLNDFKYINDTFGHDEGDQALRSVGKVLKSSFHNDLVFRYAGDEFVIICKVKNSNELSSKIKNLDKRISKFNASSKKPYSISLSKGYNVFIDKCDVTLESFINTIDTLMYKDKSTYKKIKTKETSID